MDPDLAYRPEDLLRFVDCLSGALIPGTDAVVYVTNTLDEVTEMLRLPGVPHEPFGADLALRVQRAEAILDWMDRWLKPADGSSAGS